MKERNESSMDKQPSEYFFHHQVFSKQLLNAQYLSGTLSPKIDIEVDKMSKTPVLWNISHHCFNSLRYLSGVTEIKLSILRQKLSTLRQLQLPHLCWPINTKKLISIVVQMATVKAWIYSDLSRFWIVNFCPLFISGAWKY